MKRYSDFYKLFFSPRPFDSPQFTLRGIGWREPMPPGIIDRPVGTGDWLIMHFYDPVEAGGMQGAAPRSLGADRLVIWAPGEWQYYGNPRAEYLHSWVHCDGSLVRQSLEGAGIGGGVWPGAGTMLEELVRQFRDEAALPEPDILLAMACLTVFIRRLARCCGKTPAAVAPANLQRLKKLLDDEPQQAHTLDEMALTACLSRSHLCVQFKHWFGRPPLDYQIEQRMVLAQYLLHDRNLRIGEVARRVGYEDVFYFSKLFKKRIGRSPEAFRGCLGSGHSARGPVGQAK